MASANYLQMPCEWMRTYPSARTIFDSSGLNVKNLNDVAYNGFNGNTYKKITYVNPNNSAVAFNLTAP